MPEVTITIGGRDFEVACREGEEHFLASAASMLDEEARTLQDNIGRVPENKMLLMAGLMLADRTAALDEQVAAAKNSAAEREEESVKSAASEAEILKLQADLAKMKASLAEAEAELAQAAAEQLDRDAAVQSAQKKAELAVEAKDAAIAALARTADRVEAAAAKVKKAG